MVAGICSVMTTPHITDQNVLHAAKPLTLVRPSDLPLDLQLDLVKPAKKDTIIVRDTVTIRDTIKVSSSKPKTAKKFKGTKKVKPVVKPDTITTLPKTDTLYVSKVDTVYIPSLYIIVPMDKLEEPIDTTNTPSAEEWCK